MHNLHLAESNLFTHKVYIDFDMLSSLVLDRVVWHVDIAYIVTEDMEFGTSLQLILITAHILSLQTLQ